jgi:hypothetical protein
LALAAAAATSASVRWSGATQCHGLAGAVEFLLDAASLWPERFLADAHAIARILTAFAVPGESGLRWGSETGEVVTPDYLIGYAGVGACLLRLATPGRPRQLSRAGLRYRAPSPTNADESSSATHEAQPH